MNGTGYKILGFLVWQGGKWYVRRKGAQMLPSPRTAGVAAAVTALGRGARWSSRGVATPEQTLPTIALAGVRFVRRSAGARARRRAGLCAAGCPAGRT